MLELAYGVTDTYVFNEEDIYDKIYLMDSMICKFLMKRFSPWTH